jgi:hypothetical protein
MEFLSARAPRCTLVNVETQERFECLLNPEGLAEKITVNYRRHVVPGLGYQPLQYESTSNRQVPSLEFVLDQRFSPSDEGAAHILRFRTFLLAFTKPVVPEIPSAPPRVLVVWPHVLTLEGVLSDVEFRYQALTADGSVLAYVATCTFEEVLELRGAGVV